jgi:hypothetical protein
LIEILRAVPGKGRTGEKRGRYPITIRTPRT